MISLLLSWWKSSGSSNSLTFLLLVLALWIGQEQWEAKREAKSETDRAYEVVERNNDAAETMIDRLRKEELQLTEFKKELENEELSDYLDRPIPDAIHQRM